MKTQAPRRGSRETTMSAQPGPSWEISLALGYDVIVCILRSMVHDQDRLLRCKAPLLWQYIALIA